MIRPLDTIGWTATAIFGCSYLFRKPSTLRRIQALAAVMWVVYGLLIGAMPVVVANVIVATAAVWSSFVSSRSAAVGQH
ncbi:MAG TPA: YgjV family protein [Verrucomicrobiae bacterium]|jgi:hypothetical protein|nr:YgjV family protein [Verrucomicrobiae bacterium]